ncbi:MAG: hypothetical protein ABJA02_03465 [Acidobacteriota bacterium]
MLGAVTASVVLFAGEVGFILIMGKTLMAAREAAGLPDIAPNALLSILELVITGTLLVWLYASIKARYGPGLLTAIRAGVAGWVAVVVLSTIHMIGENLGFTPSLLVLVAAVIFPVFLASAIAGSWVYRD